MLRALGAFLMIFWLLSLLMQIPGTLYLFGALAMFAIDLLMHLWKVPRVVRRRGEPLL